jgi:hypothetical protein
MFDPAHDPAWISGISEAARQVRRSITDDVVALKRILETPE